MTTITIRCTCGKLLKGKLVGEGTLTCLKCYKEYKRIYNAKKETYEIK